MLYEFIDINRDEIITKCRAKVAARLIPPPTELEINHGVPQFLDQLVEALRHQEMPMPQIGRTAALHGHELLQRGYTVGQVVHDYGDVCQSITELAFQPDAPIDADEFRTLNRCLDDAIADAVTAYASDGKDSATREENERGSVQLGLLVHELRNLLQTATFASEALLTGSVGLSGNTAAVLRRSLTGLKSLMDRSIADIRQAHGIQHPEIFAVPTFVEQLAAAAMLGAQRRKITLSVMLSEKDTEIFGDPQNLAAAINNLLQNAVKFTREGTTVTLRTVTSRDRVLIEVQDECGGLPAGTSAELVHPFQQRGAGRCRTGLGVTHRP